MQKNINLWVALIKVRVSTFVMRRIHFGFLTMLMIFFSHACNISSLSFFMLYFILASL